MARRGGSNPSGRKTYRQRDMEEDSLKDKEIIDLSDVIVPPYGIAGSSSTELAQNTGAGSLNHPINVCDTKVDKEEEADSVVAIRGERRPRDAFVATVKPPIAEVQTKKREAQGGKRKQSSKSKIGKVSRKEASKEDKKSRKAGRGATKEDGPATPTGAKTTNGAPPSSPPRSPSSKASSRISRSSKQTKSSKSSSVHIDVTALCDTEDPALENELEEIALNGRSGLISGTPGAYDIEKGKKPRQPKKAEEPAPHAEALDDEADKSWHNLADNGLSKNQFTFNKYMLIMIMLGVLSATIGLIVVLVNKSKRDGSANIVDNTKLTTRQQEMDEIVQRLSDESILTDPHSPQYSARRWLLFQDFEVIEVKEQQVIQRYVLACLFFATGGEDAWASKHNWLKGNECQTDKGAWLGIGCSSEGQVRAIALDNHGLKGTIPPEVGHLGTLEHLILKNHPELIGWIPRTLGHMRELSQLGLYNNALSGTIPDIFDHNKNLQYVNLENNNLWGSIPLGLKNLHKLDTLVLSNNRFEGIVPMEQLAQTTIKYLGLSHNKFSSMLEHSIKDVNSLEYLYLDNNQMRGKIPEQIEGLTNLKSLDLGFNQFTGVLPSQIGNLDRLEFLSTNANQLKGELPKELGLLTNLKTLNLSTNSFTGPIPNISNMVHLKNLQMFENGLTGSIPEAIQQLQSIEILFLSSNALTGTIPRSIQRLSRTLRGLYLSNNQLQGRIPQELCTFGGLEALFLDANILFGPIPECIGDLTELRQLYLFQNKLTGDVPSTFENLRYLNGLGLEQNDMAGEMPDEICGLVDEFALDIWADCKDVFGSDPLLCSCCSVCCPSDECT